MVETVPPLDIIVYCAGGQGRHIAWLIKQIGGYNLLGFVDNSKKFKGRKVYGLPVFPSLDAALRGKSEICIAVANGTPRTTATIVQKIKQYNQCSITFPNLIHPSVLYDAEGVKFGEGNIINVGTNLTTDIEIGDFNYFNRYCVIGHDTYIGSFCNFCTSVIIGGNVTIGNYNFFGMGTRIIEKRKIGNNVLTGAGAIIQTDVEDNSVMVMPNARLFRYQKPVNFKDERKRK